MSSPYAFSGDPIRIFIENKNPLIERVCLKTFLFTIPKWLCSIKKKPLRHKATKNENFKLD